MEKDPRNMTFAEFLKYLDRNPPVIDWHKFSQSERYRIASQLWEQR